MRAALQARAASGAWRLWIIAILLYPLFIIADPGLEDCGAAQEDGPSICQATLSVARGAMLRRVLGFKWYIPP